MNIYIKYLLIVAALLICFVILICGYLQLRELRSVIAKEQAKKIIHAINKRQKNKK